MQSSIYVLLKDVFGYRIGVKYVGALEIIKRAHLQQDMFNLLVLRA